MQIAFCVVVFLFVGLRYETGFDWPVYKRAFELLSDDFSLESIILYSQTFQIEMGWLIVSGAAGQIFPEYEFLQALVTATLLLSVYKLSRALGVRNFALAISIASSFLLLTLMFSTIRQCFALSIFNFAIVAALNKRWKLMLTLSVFAVSVHVSTLFYILALVYAAARPSKLPTPMMVIFMSVIGIGGILAIPLVSNYLPDLLASRVVWYGLDEAFQEISWWQVYFIILGAFIAGFALLSGPIGQKLDNRVTFHRRMILGLAIMCLCTYSLDVVRDRISYEMFLLFSIYLARDDLPLRLLARPIAFALGIFFSMLNIFIPANRIAFMPYQNALTVLVTGEKGDGQFRQESFNRDFDVR